MKEKLDYLFSKINWGASFLDAKSIDIMNTIGNDIEAQEQQIKDFEVVIKERIEINVQLHKQDYIWRELVKEQEQEIKELKEFIKWYSGMEQSKIDAAYKRFKKEQVLKQD